MTTPSPLPGPMPPQLDHLLDGDEFTAVTHTVLDNNPGMTDDLAQRITAEAIKFVATCAANRFSPIAPSRVVDEGWHALILHTALYQRLCTDLGGFVHHFPERPDPGRYDSAVLDLTVQVMAEAGLDADPSLWLEPTDGRIVVAANCQHCPAPCGPVTPIPKPKGGVVAAIRR